MPLGAQHNAVVSELVRRAASLLGWPSPCKLPSQRMQCPSLYASSEQACSALRCYLILFRTTACSPTHLEECRGLDLLLGHCSSAQAGRGQLKGTAQAWPCRLGMQRLDQNAAFCSTTTHGQPAGLGLRRACRAGQRQCDNSLAPPKRSSTIARSSCCVTSTDMAAPACAGTSSGLLAAAERGRSDGLQAGAAAAAVEPSEQRCRRSRCSTHV